MATILITGGSGMIGQALAGMLLREGNDVIILTRKLPASNKVLPGLSYAVWDIKAQKIDTAAIAAADHIVHLAGAGIADERWSEKRKKEIVDSRVDSCKLIVKALSEIPNKVQSVLSASAIGWYGPDTATSRTDGFTEDALPDKSFLGETCRLWEESIVPVTKLGKRLVILRTGIVLSNKGGAFVEFKKPLIGGIAAVLGSGEQVVSWIHVDDLCRIYMYAMERTGLNGVFNAVAPDPVTNEALTITLAKKKRGRFYLKVKVPEIILKTALGEMSIEVLKSATVSAGKILSTGFSFSYATIDKAVTQLIAD